ncbi:unnamed protein product, partial [Meganyctiphanes norvegica]
GGTSLDYTKKETALRKMLFTDYDKNARPSEQTNITITGVEVLKWDMMVESHTFKLDVWFKSQWTDPRLAWEGKGYDDLSQLSVPQDMVWKPDFSVYNGVDLLSIGKHAGDAVNVILYPSGLVMFIPPAELVGICTADVTYFPHDVHDCAFKIGSWIHHGYHLHIETTANSLEFEKEWTGACESGCLKEWEMLDHSMKAESSYYECCPEPYMNLRINVKIQRQAPALTYSIKIPAIGLSLLCLALFLLPPGAGEKIILGGLLLLCDLLFLDQVMTTINFAPTHTPLLVRLVGEQMTLLVISVLLSAWVIRVARGPHASALPTFIKNPLLSISPLLGLSNYKNQAIKRMVNNGKESEVEIGESNTLTPIYKNDAGTTQADWMLFAATIDRLMFITYLVVIIISLLAFSSVL